MMETNGTQGGATLFLTEDEVALFRGGKELSVMSFAFDR